MDLQTREKRFFVATEEPEDLQVTRAEDEFLFDANGKRYIDFNSGWCVGNLGWGRKEIKSAIARSKTPDYVAPDLRYKRWADLAELLASIAPQGLQRCIRTTGGTESVEAAMQIAMIYTGRTKFLSIEGSYHGNSIATLSIGSSDNKEQFQNLLPNCLKIDLPLDSDTAAKVETRLKSKDIAAFIMEPVICNIGVTIPEHAFMKRLSALCKRYGTLLVMDEVACGFGRTGKMFATEHFEIEPDILCVAKAITGGYAPMGACITTTRIADNILKNGFQFYSTYGWHPFAVEVAIANIQFWKKHQRRILDNVALLSQYFTERLTQMKFKKPPVTIRTIGLAIAIDVNSEKYADQVQQKCLKKGLLFTTQDKTLTFFPPLTLRKAIAKKALDILESCL